MSTDTSDENVDSLMQRIKLGANNTNMMAEIYHVLHQLRSERNMMHYQVKGMNDTVPWARALSREDRKHL